MSRPPRCDLHLHSHHSDGLSAPEELAQAASRFGLKAIALTDHDTFGGVQALVEAAQPLGLEVLSGVEITTFWEGEEWHLLAYGCSRENQALLDVLSSLRQWRRDRLEAYASHLEGRGVAVDRDLVNEEVGEASAGRVHLARVLTRAGYGKNLFDTFREYLGERVGEGCPLSLSRAIEVVHRAGGKAILAHPGIADRWDRQGQESGLAKMVALGLDGLETRHPGHRKSIRKRLERWCRDRGLLMTGGSDFHGRALGDVRKGRGIGHVEVDASIVDVLQGRD